jgi:hypothetical protein
MSGFCGHSNEHSGCKKRRISWPTDRQLINYSPTRFYKYKPKISANAEGSELDSKSTR